MAGASPAAASSFGLPSLRAGQPHSLGNDSPFRLNVISGSGKRLLTSVTDSFASGGVRYGGFSFTVGAEPELAPPVIGTETGDSPPVPEPKRYVGRRMVSIAKSGPGVRVVLATDDPAGRKIVLMLTRRRGVLGVEMSVSRIKGVSAISAAFTTSPGEAFHGFGGRRESTDLRGLDMKSWVLDYRYPDASTGWYSPYPGFISSRGYGVLLGGDRISRWRMASDSPRAWRVSKQGVSLRLSVVTGGPKQSISRLTSITGRHRLPPNWSTGAMLSRTIGILGDSAPGSYQGRVTEDVDRIVSGDLPVASYGFEGWAAMPRDFVEEQIARLKAAGIKSFLYLRSFVSNDSAGTEKPGAFDEATGRGLVATKADGTPYLFPSPFPGGQAAIVDFTDPAAVKWWRSRVFELLDTGAVGFMNDFGEQVEPGMHFADGTPASVMHNRYPVLQAKVTREAVNAWEKRNPGPKVFFFQRAGFSGRPGSAAYENGQFPGDETVDWQEGTGLPSIVPDMLNRAVLGSPGMTVDIGGYAQFTRERPILPATSAELFTRWSQAAALTPFFRVHNSGLDGARMPWDFDGPTLERWKAMARLHDRARPLTRRLWDRFEETGIPMTRPLWLVDPALARNAHADDEWLLGNDLLVAPVLVEGATTREVALPAGCWKLRGGGRAYRVPEVTVDAPIASLPWFSRCGTRPLG